ncbi:MAG: elongation factor 1-beta [Candidatus Aenigmarchaeota archaeon]|nr:elongation factor 1-beta [Candidatus Aenigmarchaeota archaeon]
MGDVAISITVVPNGPEVNLDELKEKIKDVVDVKDIKEEPIGFGLKNIKILIVRPDSEGQGTDDIEEKLSGLEGVSSVRVEDVTLI